MPQPILVTYATCAGSTRGVAEAIAQTLAADGTPVEVHPMQEVHDLASYSAVVAGSAIHGGKWLPEGFKFLQQHRAALAQKPVAAFLVCMTMTMSNPQYRAGVADWMKPVHAYIQPVSEGLFAGALEGKNLSFFDRLSARAMKAAGFQEGDHRDWNAIRTWTEKVRPLLV